MVEPRDTLAQVGRSWGLILALGIASAVAGIATLAWPGRTIAVVAVLIGLQLLVAGVVRLVGVFSVDDRDHRAWGVVVGLASIVVGILCLRDVFQTIAALTLLVGVLWVIQGVAEFFAGVAGVTERRGLTILIGVLGFVAGVVVLVYPIQSVLTLAIVLGVWLTISGVVEIAAAFRVRASARSAAA